MAMDDFQTKYAAVMDTLLQTAIAETTKMFESVVGELKAEISRIKEENQQLKLKCSQMERTRSRSTFKVAEKRPSSDMSKKRNAAVQCDLLAFSTRPTNQHPQLWMPSFHPTYGRLNGVNALHDHNYDAHTKRLSEWAAIMPQMETSLRPKSECLVNGGHGVRKDISLSQRDDTKVAAEITILEVYGNVQGYPTQSSDPSKHSLDTQPAAHICDNEISEVCQDVPRVSPEKFLPSDHRQLLDPPVKLSEGEQAITVPLKDESDDEAFLPEQTDVSVPQLSKLQSSLVKLPRSASSKTQDFCDGRTNVGSTLHSENVELGGGQSQEDVIHPLPYVKEVWTQSDQLFPMTVKETPQAPTTTGRGSSSPAFPQAPSVQPKESQNSPLHLNSVSNVLSLAVNPETSVDESLRAASQKNDTVDHGEDAQQSVSPVIDQIKICEENLNAVVRLTRLPFTISKEDTILVSRLPTGIFYEHMSFLKHTKHTSTIPALLPLNTSGEQLCEKEKSNLCSDSIVTMGNESQNNSSAGKPTLKPREGKLSDPMQDYSLNGGSKEKMQSATLGKSSSVSEDTGVRNQATCKDQCQAQLAVSALVEAPKKASSGTAHAKASCAETPTRVKEEQISVLVQLKNRMKRHAEARGTNLVPQMELLGAKRKMLRLELDRCNAQSTRVNLSGKETSLKTEDATANAPTTTVTCPKDTVVFVSCSGSSKSKANESPSVSRQSLGSSSFGRDSQKLSSVPEHSKSPGKPEDVAFLNKCAIAFVDCKETRAVRKSAATKDAEASISLRSSKLTQVSKDEVVTPTAKAGKITESNGCKMQKLQTGVKESCRKAPRKSSSQAVLTPLDMPCSQKTSPRAKMGLKLSKGKNAKSSPAYARRKPVFVAESPVDSPTKPLAIGTRLLKNQCGECGQVLNSKAALENHVSLHKSKDPFSCSLCGKSYPDSVAFKRHGRIHQNGRIHLCHLCGKGFVLRFALSKHIEMVHNNLRPFVCQICNKGCFSKIDVEAHIRMHTGEKPFKCNLCDKKFSRRVNLNVHLRRHNGEKRHWCQYCGKGFLDSNNYKRHKYTHTGEKPHSCPHCPKQFTQSGHLSKHLKTMHKGK